ncbi:MAG: Serine/threonine-protein kinase PknD [Thermoanaerobaculia bacterium]|nr:Serine/threonine-protein kinase PknD [Thermoanaerobaculia bacterium]
MAVTPGARFGPYQILSPLGAGGMGEVYRARDTRLDRDVAIKVLPEDVANDPKALARFEAEAKAVAALSHPNILALYDIGSEAGTRYAVTELLEGQTLRAVIASGPLPPRRALDLVIPIATGLAAAHEKGIVHRDLKPENVFVTRDGHVKVLDFGLARRTPGRSSGSDTQTVTAHLLSEPGSVAGTVTYMSPEQARGQHVDHRSDQFSLGIVLYEMLTGTRPFGGATAADVMAAIIRDEPRRLEERAPGTPEPVSWLVTRLLSKEPEGRYESTRDLAKELTLCRTRLSEPGGPGSGARAEAAKSAEAASAAAAETAETVKALEAAKSSSRRRLVWIAAAAVALLAVGAVGFWKLRERPTVPKAAAPVAPALDPKKIAVATFDNQTGDASLSYLGRLAAEQVIGALAKVTTVKVIPSSTVLPALADGTGAASGKDPVHALAESTGAGTVISGSYYLVGPNVQIQAKVTDVTASKLLWPIELASAPREKAGEAVEAVCRQVLDVLAARFLSPMFDMLRFETSPPRFEAYQEVLRGHLASDGLPAAIEHDRRALELDPGFQFARMQLAGHLGNMGLLSEAEAEFDRLDATRERQTPALRKRIDRRRASVFARLEEWYALSVELAASEPGTGMGLSVSAFQSNRPRHVVTLLRSPGNWSAPITPDNPFSVLYFMNLTGALHQLGEHEEELNQARRAREIYPNHLNAWAFEARALVALGRLPEVDALVTQVLSLPPKWSWQSCCMPRGTPGFVMLAAAEELRVHGHHERSRAMATRAVEWHRGRAGEEAEREENRLRLGESLYMAERWQEAQEAFGGIAAGGASAIARQGWLGVTGARRGDRAGADRISGALARTWSRYNLGTDTLWRARIAAVLGDRDGAVTLLRECVAQGGGYTKVERELYGYGLNYQHLMDLETLRGYPPFEELVKPKG